MSMKTQGTHLYMVSTTGSVDEVIRIGCPTAIGYSGSPVDQFESTCLEVTDARTYRTGLKTPGTANISVDFDTANASHMAIYDQYGDIDDGVTQWAIGFSDGTDAPTLDSYGNFDLPTSRSWVSFSGYISDLSLDFALNSLVKADVPIQISGKVTITPKA